MKKWLRVCLAIALIVACVGMTACGGASQTSDPATPAADGSATTAPEDNGQTFVIRMGNTAAYPNQPNWIMRKFKEEIEAATDRITVELYEASAFGGPNEMVQGLQSGAMQCVLIPTGFYGSSAPACGILDLPGLFADPSEATWVLNQETPALDEYFQAQGFAPEAWFYEVNRDYLTLVPVNSLADFKGLNLRTYTVDVSQETIKALGANPIIMGTGDVPMALQQKTIDGCEAGVTMMAAAKYYDLAKYFLIDLGAPIPNPAMFSKMFLDSLPAELNELVTTTMYDICMGEGMDYSMEYCEAVYKEMEDNGCVVTSASPEFKQDWLDATAYITTDFLAANPNMQTAYDELQALITEYRSK